MQYRCAPSLPLYASCFPYRYDILLLEFFPYILFFVFQYLLMRSFRDSYRNPLIALSNLLQYLFTALLSVFAWWYLRDDEDGARK